MAKQQTITPYPLRTQKGGYGWGFAKLAALMSGRLTGTNVPADATKSAG